MRAAQLANANPEPMKAVKVAAVAARTDVAVPRLRQAVARPGNAIARLEAVLDESGRLMRE